MASGMSQISVTTPDEGRISVLCPSAGNVLDVKKAVAEQRGVPIEKISIIFAGAIQKDDIPIKEFARESTVRLIIRK